ncbi:MAG: hypothetical protein K6F09_07765 [Clostridiales bacterium]|nr:hypothetical protein [Clostridiales bacterium]
MKTFLFQGDSITDAGRSRDNLLSLGEGYPNLTAGFLGFKYPGQYTFINKGISGNRSVDMYARVKADAINLEPSYMSILIGINDVWHEFGHNNGVSAEKYEKILSMFVEEVKEALPEIKILILEPFVLKGAATAERYDEFVSGTTARAEAAKRISDKFDLTFVPLQDKFNEALKLAPADYWLLDGVHPSVNGHELITKELVNAFEKIK